MPSTADQKTILNTTLIMVTPYPQAYLVQLGFL